MSAFLKELFSSHFFMPHGHCYLWLPGMVWLQVLSNAFIGLAYVSISATIYYIMRRIQNIPFKWIFLAFGVFIVSCGMTHFMDVVTIWSPFYWLDGSIRVVTAVASVGTAVVMFPLVPKAISLAGASRLADQRGIELEIAHKELARLYEVSKESLQEKEVLLREVHHRVKNNLQVISSLLAFQATYATEPQADQMFKEAQNRVAAMALVHEKLYQSKDLARIRLVDYLEDLAAELFRAYGVDREQVRVSFDIGDLFLEVNAAIPTGLIVNELLSNCLKHAFPTGRGTIEVQVRSVNEGPAQMVVRDDGIGLPPGFELEKVPTLGLRIVQMLVRQLHGSIARGHGGGTEFILTLHMGSHGGA